jgi:hypothetical protein
MASLLLLIAKYVIPLVTGWIAKEALLWASQLQALPGPLVGLLSVAAAVGVSVLSGQPLDQDVVNGALMALVAYLTHQSAQLRTKRLAKGLKR